MLEALEDMTEDAKIAIQVTKVFAMPDEISIKRLVPNRCVCT